MSEHLEELSEKQQAALAALLAHPTVEAAAAAVDVNRHTLARWRQQPRFAEALTAARREAVAQTAGRLSTASNTAVETLHELMQDPAATPASRIMAARAVLTLTYRLVALEELAERVAHLENPREEN